MTREPAPPDKIAPALNLALQEHAGQTRIGGRVPYIVHVCDVIGTLYNVGVEDEVTLTVAALHDVLEDSKDPDRAEASIEAFFGQRVLACVQSLTKPRSGSRADKRWAMLDKLRSAWPEAQAVKMADRLSNIRSIGRSGWDFDRVKAYCDDAVEIAEIAADANPVLSVILQSAARQALENVRAVDAAELGDQVHGTE